MVFVSEMACLSYHFSILPISSLICLICLVHVHLGLSHVQAHLETEHKSCQFCYNEGISRYFRNARDLVQSILHDVIRV